MQRNPISTMYTDIIFIKFFKLSKCEVTNACVLSISSKCKISPLLLFVFNGCCGFLFCVSTVTCILIRHLHRYCVELEPLIKNDLCSKAKERDCNLFRPESIPILNLLGYWFSFSAYEDHMLFFLCSPLRLFLYDSAYANCYCSFRAYILGYILQQSKLRICVDIRSS